MLYMQMTDPIINADDLKSGSDSEVERLINNEVSFGGWLNSDSLVVARLQQRRRERRKIYA